ncbi:MAG: hypothetical protein KAT05_17390, partial [Spirochaetes bacterium]|nr:hypothetical protein [Spirochaetota bacterium]
KFVDIYKIVNGNLSLIDKIEVPYYTVFFDVGDLDNNGKCDIVFLASDGLYYRDISHKFKENKVKLKHIKSIKSEIVVPQPELLTDVNMVVDLDGNGTNELIIENIRAIEIFETKNFKKLASIELKTILEYALIPGQFYPHYIFYTLPIILLKDLDNDNKKEIITKFPTTINVYSQNNLSDWGLKNRIFIGRDNVYFLSNSYVKFAFPVITDIDNDTIKEIVVSSVNLNMPRLKFEAIGDVYFLNKKNFKLNKNKKIIVKGIPLNLPKFFNISTDKYKDFIIPVVPFNLISVFGLLSGAGSVKVPFMHFKQDKEKFDVKHPKKLFEIRVRIENITSFVEELPLDQYKEGEYPDFYYFSHDFKKKTVNILYYYYYKKKEKYYSTVVKSLSIPGYRPELPSTLKLGNFSKNAKKDVVFITHKNLFVISRQ